MKNTWKAILLMMLCLVMAFSMTACGGGDGDQGDQGSSKVGEVSEEAQGIATDLGIDYSTLCPGFVAVEGVTYPEVKKSEFFVFLDASKDDAAKLADLYAFKDYFQTLADDGKIYTSSDFTQEWFDEILYEGMSSNFFNVKMNGKKYYVAINQYPDKYSAITGEQMYTYGFALTEV